VHVPAGSDGDAALRSSLTADVDDDAPSRANTTRQKRDQQRQCNANVRVPTCVVVVDRTANRRLDCRQLCARELKQVACRKRQHSNALSTRVGRLEERRNAARNRKRAKQRLATRKHQDVNTESSCDTPIGGCTQRVQHGGAFRRRVIHKQHAMQRYSHKKKAFNEQWKSVLCYLTQPCFALPQHL
jgi:hypothetical protein